MNTQTHAETFNCDWSLNINCSPLLLETWSKFRSQMFSEKIQRRTHNSTALHSVLFTTSVGKLNEEHANKNQILTICIQVTLPQNTCQTSLAA